LPRQDPRDMLALLDELRGLIVERLADGATVQ
jgi:hypothetical protein